MDFNYRSSNLMLIDTIYCWNQDTLFAQFPGGRLGLKDSITNQLQETLITKTEFQTLFRIHFEYFKRWNTQSEYHALQRPEVGGCHSFGDS
ncbi:MAG: hypothetical protein HWD58_22275 [Bacteroidota bacterium]|nr:MAG: hypothetical protein HWD58_22275 [Bacteroidota bacterium]